MLARAEGQRGRWDASLAAAREGLEHAADEGDDVPLRTARCLEHATHALDRLGHLVERDRLVPRLLAAYRDLVSSDPEYYGPIWTELADRYRARERS